MLCPISLCTKMIPERRSLELRNEFKLVLCQIMLAHNNFIPFYHPFLQGQQQQQQQLVREKRSVKNVLISMQIGSFKHFQIGFIANETTDKWKRETVRGGEVSLTTPIFWSTSEKGSFSPALLISVYKIHGKNRKIISNLVIPKPIAGPDLHIFCSCFYIF